MPTIPLHIGPRRSTVEWQADNAFSLTADLQPGLYVCTVQCDLARFDWERLWVPLDLYGNKGQRTGPWDFDLYKANSPLIPTWRLSIDGRYIGLFYLQRPTVEDVANKTLRGQFGFQRTVAGPVTVSAVPFNSCTIDPIAMRIESSAFDVVEEQPWAAAGLSANWAHHIAHERGWADIRRHMTAHGLDGDVDMAIAGAMEHASTARTETWCGFRPELVPMMCLAWQLRREPQALKALVNYFEFSIERPAWGNPNPDGYSHNGDLGAAYAARACALAYNWIGDDFGPLKARILERLERQMDIYVEQMLLMEQYWGGAVQQDHGYRSTQIVTLAALYMLGHSPKAPGWLSIFVPRVRRMVATFPTDGFLPGAQYHSVHLAITDMSDLRAALLHAGSFDIYKLAPGYVHVSDFVLSCFDEPTQTINLVSCRGDSILAQTGLNHYLQVAGDFDSPTSRHMASLLLESYRAGKYRFPSPMTVYDVLPQAFLNYRADRLDAKRPTRPALQHFPDGGVVIYRDNATRYNVAMSCVPNGSAFHAIGTDLTGTDMMVANVSAGNFTVALNGRTLLQSAESSYRTHTNLTNVLLIDEQGQYGDIGYTMAVPMQVHRGHRIQTCQLLSPDGRHGRSRVNLAPAYPDALEVLEYTRDFVYFPDHTVVRDTVVTRQPHRFSYRFQTWDTHGVKLLDATDLAAEAVAGFRIASPVDADGPAVAVQVEVVGADGWALQEAPTDVVWGYTHKDTDPGYKHVEVAITAPTSSFVVEFHIKPLWPTA